MTEQQLKEKAIKVSDHAYAPYSHFRVGCAILTKKGNIYVGCNVENASYGLTICAERNAIANAIASEGKIELEKVIIFTPTDTATLPCGACRQVIHEFGNPTIISYYLPDKASREYKADQLLPHAFDLDH